MPISSSGSFMSGSLSNTLSATLQFTSSAYVPTGSVVYLAVAVDNLNCIPINAWSAGGAMIQIRGNLGGAGTQNEALAFSGNNAPTAFNLACTEEYNGATWTAGGAMITARSQVAGAGTQNAGLSVGGQISGVSTASTCTEEYNGTSWSSGGALINATFISAGAGIQNAALRIGGCSNTAVINFTEEYDGTSWSAGGAIITGRSYLAGAGTQNEALAFGGGTPTLVTCTEEYNGSTWAVGGAINTARNTLAGAGTQNAALAFGGAVPTVVNSTEAYNGTVWRSVNSMITARCVLAGAGSQVAGLAFGGQTPTVVACTEEYNITSTFYTSSLICCITDNNPNNNRFSYSVIGTGSAFNGAVRAVYCDGSGNYIVGGDFTTYNGESAPYLVRLNSNGVINTKYDINGPVNKIIPQGSLQGIISTGVWLAGTALITARQCHAAAGTPNATLIFGNVAAAHSYNGTSWSVGGSLISNRSALAGAGTQNEALAFGGANLLTCTEEYNGSTWATGGAMNVGRMCLGGAGTQNAALAFGGARPPGAFNLFPATNSSEAYDGTTWSSTCNLNTSRWGIGGLGIQNAALALGGTTYNQPNTFTTSAVECYNGLSWSGFSGLTVARTRGAQGGSTISALSFGGRNGNYWSTPVSGLNGISWNSCGNLINVRQCTAGTSTSNVNGLIAGGTQGVAPSATSGTSFTEVFYSPLTPAGSGSYSQDTSNKLLILGSFTCYRGIAASGSVRIHLTDQQSQDLLFNTANGSNSTVCTAATISTPQYTIDVGKFFSNNPLWRIGSAMIGCRSNAMAVGSSDSDILTAGGANPIVIGTVETFNGVSWTSRTSLITARQGLAGAGTSNLALAFGAGTCTEEYNGSTWSTGGALITSRSDLAGAGTQNEALAFGGGLSICTEEYNGTTWSSGGSMITARSFLAGAGTQNAGLAFGGSPTGGINPPRLACTEEYDGTTWTAGGNMASATGCFGGSGIQNAAIAAGGGSVPAGAFSSTTQIYNGTAWSFGSGMNVAKTNNRIGGSNTSAVTAGGAFRTFPGPTTAQSTCTEIYSTCFAYTNRTILGGTFSQYSGSSCAGAVSVNVDGTINQDFKIGPGFSTADVRSVIATGSLVVFGGDFTSYSGSSVNRIVGVDSGSGAINTSFNVGTGFNAAVNSLATQSFNGNILAAGAFTQYSGSNINRVARLNSNAVLDTLFCTGVGSGLDGDACVVCVYPHIAQGWSTRTAMITSRTGLSRAGIQNDALAFGGFTTVVVSCTEEYNGAAWTVGRAMITARCQLAGAGTQNAGIGFGGDNIPTRFTCTEVYDGTTWTVRSSMIACRTALGGTGTQNEALAFGGDAIPSFVACTEEYNGITWATGGALIISRGTRPGSAGTQNEALAFGGCTLTIVACTEEYNGTSWSTGGAMITARQQPGSSGIQNAALAFGGATPALSSCTEKYNGTGWSTSNAMITARSGLGSAGLQTSALAFGGSAPGIVTCTEAYNEAQILVGGTFTAFSGSAYSGSVRLNVTGALDTTWNIGTGFSGSTEVLDYNIVSPTQQAGTQVIAVGNFTNYGGLTSNCIQGVPVNPQPSQNRLLFLNSDGTMAGTYLGTFWNKVSEIVETSGSFVVGTGTTGSGVAVALFQNVVTGSMQPNVSGTISLAGSIINKAASGWVFGSLPTGNAVFTSSISGSSFTTLNPPSMSFTALSMPASSTDNLLLRVVAHEGPPTNPFTATPGFTSLGSVVGTNDVSLAGEFISTATGTTVSSPIYLSGSNASIYSGLRFAVAVIAGKTYYILID